MAQFRDLFGMGKSENGQILLVVVLTTIVALTVGLSVASRTITNLKLSKENEESQRAFQAAEAGVEEAIKQVGSQTTLTNSLPNSSTFDTTITEEKSNSFLLNNGDVVQQDLGQDVWLSSYPDYASPLDVDVTLRWGTSEQSCSGTESQVMPAIEVVMLTGTKDAPSVVKHVYDTCSGRVSGGAEPQTGGSGVIEGVNFTNSVILSESDKLIMKVIPLFNSGKIGVSAPSGMPSQGKVIESVGSAGSTKRKIVYFESYPQIPPEIFPYTIISQ